MRIGDAGNKRDAAQQLMRQADQSLYAAKKAGRNRVVGRLS